MPSVLESVIARGGIAATFELHADGHPRGVLARAVRARAVLRVRQGWYARPDLHPAILASVRLGGRLACCSALALHGGWDAEPDRLHVALAPNACRPRSPHDSRQRLDPAHHPAITLHWRMPSDGARGIAPPLAAFDDAVHCLTPELASVAIGSLLHARPELRREWHRWLLDAPRHMAQWLRRIDGVCESGLEGLWWFRMRGRLPRVRRQVLIPDVGRVDFLVGERLVIEVDGAEYHTDPVSFERDRRRDAELSAIGYRVLRFSYRQIMDRWGEVDAAVLAAVARGDTH